MVSGSPDHALLIYGGDYDKDGKPLSYLIKDPFEPVIYRESADEIHKILRPMGQDRPAANLTDWPKELIEGFRALLKGGTVIATEQAAGVGLNEPEAFRRIEPFHCARRHNALLSN